MNQANSIKPYQKLHEIEDITNLRFALFSYLHPTLVELIIIYM